MNDAHGPNREVLGLGVAQAIDPVCDRFEAAWKAAGVGGPRPRVEDYVEASAGSESETLLRELVLLDIHYRRRAGECPTADDYGARFPELEPTWLVHALSPSCAPPARAGGCAAAVAGEPGLADSPRSTQAAPLDLPDDQKAAAAVATIPRHLGDYRILREVGRGGMGVVYEAVQESLGRHVALKVLPFNSLLGPTYLERFRREARAAAKLHHTNIVPVYGVGEHEGVHYYAMQYIDGRGLDIVLREVKRMRTAPGRPEAGQHGLAVDVAESLVWRGY
jgi:hypothetical protein